MSRSIVDYLVSPDSLAGESDVLDVVPSLSYDDAYVAQFAAKEQQAARNGPRIGYQASLTSEGAKRFGPPDMPKPYIGTLQLRNWHNPDAPISRSGREFFVECEVGMRLAKPLSGTNVTAAQAREAVGSMHAALEIVPVNRALMTRSGQHMIAVHNFGSHVVFGDGSAPDPELYRAPFELFFDGKPVAQAVAGDSGGDPFAVLAEIANILGKFDRGIEPGMVIMTGSAVAPTQLPDDVSRVEARLGGVGTASVTLV